MILPFPFVKADTVCSSSTTIKKQKRHQSAKGAEASAAAFAEAKARVNRHSAELD
jgi:hypothetical protein